MIDRDASPEGGAFFKEVEDGIPCECAGNEKLR